MVAGQASASARRIFGNTWSTDQASGDQTYRLSTSTDEQGYALTVIQAERSYRRGKYGTNPSDLTVEARNTAQGSALTDHRSANNLTFATWQVSSAGVDWAYDQASANRDYTDAVDDAHRLDAYNVQLAFVQRTYDQEIVDADVSEAGANQTAKQQRAIGLATPEFNYRANLAAAEASAWNAVRLETPNAWADAKYRDALGRSLAWAA